MSYSPRWKMLMFTSGLALLPACGMEAPGEAPDSDVRPTMSQTSDALSLGSETTTLPARGGSGGSPTGLACPTNQVAVGIHGTVVTYVNSLGLLCRTLNADGTLGASSSTAMAGPGWGSAFSIQCPTGQAVVGFPGHSGGLLDGIGLHCAAPNAWMNSAQVQASVAEVGSASGNAFSDVCPQERVVTRLYVQTGDNVDLQMGTCTRMVNPPPASCQDIKARNPSAADGAYTLYVGADASKPWTAWCQGMSGTPAEYLSLPSTGASANFSQYTAGSNNGAGSTNVRTLFTKVRIDPVTLRVSTGDQRFSTSSGQLNHGGPVTSMSYAASMSCDFGAPGVGNVDLRGTPFAAAANQFAVVGSYASGQATYSANSQVVDLWSRGDCAWNSVVGADHPFNGRNFSLQLQYTTLSAPPGQPSQPTSGSFTYNASNTNSASQNTTPFDVRLTAGQRLQFGTCTVAGSSGTGDTYLRLYAPDGSNVVAIDDSCGLLSFGDHTATQTGTYRIQAGCYSGGSCGGTVAFTIQ